MRALVLGGGAREHAIASRFARSQRIRALFAAPGNSGMAEVCDGVSEIDPTDANRVVRFARDHRIELVFVGPETVLSAGVVDALSESGIEAIGPNQSAARLESSKLFAKEFMRNHSIPTAESEKFDEYPPFERYVSSRSGTIVVKKSGLAAGKGVLESDDGAAILDFGEAILRTDSLLVEDFLTGWEVSVFAFSDGEHFRVLPACADFKKAGEGDQGPNTGGMGAICPVGRLTDQQKRAIESEIIRPTFNGMREDGLLYRGVMFFGIMITVDGPKLLEYNVRLGDPEAQVLLPLIRSDFVDLCEAMTGSTLEKHPLTISNDHAAGVVVAAEGYPGEYETGHVVTSLPPDANDELQVFHASTRQEGDTIRTNGGRCFTVVGMGSTSASASRRAYEAIPDVRFRGAWCRKDIGQKFLIDE